MDIVLGNLVVYSDIGVRSGQQRGIRDDIHGAGVERGVVEEEWKGYNRDARNLLH